MGDVIDLANRNRILGSIADPRLASYYAMGWDDGKKYGRRLLAEALVAGLAIGTLIGIWVAAIMGVKP
jgi:hypothetical protein